MTRFSHYYPPHATHAAGALRHRPPVLTISQNIAGTASGVCEQPLLTIPTLSCDTLAFLSASRCPQQRALSVSSSAVSTQTSFANWLKLPLALAALVAVAGAGSTWLLQPAAHTRRRIILSHARCACCLGQLSRDTSCHGKSDVNRCGLSTSAWLTDEVGDPDGEHHRCNTCACGLSGVHGSQCPECGAAAGRLRRAA